MWQCAICRWLENWHKKSQKADRVTVAAAAHDGHMTEDNFERFLRFRLNAMCKILNKTLGKRVRRSISKRAGGGTHGPREALGGPKGGVGPNGPRVALGGAPRAWKCWRRTLFLIFDPSQMFTFFGF